VNAQDNIPTETKAECAPWIDANKRLPHWNKLVVAYLEGTKEHTNARYWPILKS
jgi:hypothetical protein